MDFLNEALRTGIANGFSSKTSAVAPNPILHQVHVNGVSHIVVAAFRRFYDGPFNHLTRFSEGTGHVHLEEI